MVPGIPSVQKFIRDETKIPVAIVYTEDRLYWTPKNKSVMTRTVKEKNLKNNFLSHKNLSGIDSRVMDITVDDDS